MVQDVQFIYGARQYLDSPIRRSSSRRRGFGSSRRSGSVKILASGSGGQSSAERGLREAGSSDLICSSLVEVAKTSSFTGGSTTSTLGVSVASVVVGTVLLPSASWTAASYACQYTSSLLASIVPLTLMTLVARHRTARPFSQHDVRVDECPSTHYLAEHVGQRYFG
jgi:hypothetical protein